VYHVVFVCVDPNSPYEGAITWTTYGSKQELDKVRAHLLTNGSEVLKEGVSVEEAIALAKTTPALTHLNVLLSKMEEAFRAARLNELSRQRRRVFVAGDDGVAVVYGIVR